MTSRHEFDDPAIYEISVMGRLDPKWSDWFDGLELVPQANDETVLVGLVADQTALHGMLAKIRDLGLPLLVVRRVPGQADLLQSASR
jgi:hypothetical protein